MHNWDLVRQDIIFRWVCTNCGAESKQYFSKKYSLDNKPSEFAKVSTLTNRVIPDCQFDRACEDYLARKVHSS